jgi:hypothetical protein
MANDGATCDGRNLKFERADWDRRDELCVFQGGGLSTFFFANLFRGESSSASAAAPISERMYHVTRSRLIVRAFG